MHTHRPTDGRIKEQGGGGALQAYDYTDGTESMAKRGLVGCKWKIFFCVSAILIYMGIFNIITHSQLSNRSTWDPGGGGGSYVYYPHGVPIGSRYARLTRLRGWSCKNVQLSRKENLPLTALASFPGSGNTWVRHLIQQATGVATGSVYRDFALKLYGYPGEGVANRSVIVIKTHEFGAAARGRFERAILVIREPYGAILAEYNRRHAGHRGHATTANFGRAWREFVFTKSREWKEMISDWLKFRGPLHILNYDVLRKKLGPEMNKVLKFLNFTSTIRDFTCMLKNTEGLFHRPSGIFPRDHFDQKMKLRIDHIWRNVSSLISSHVSAVDSR